MKIDHHILSDGMVLQRGEPLILTGEDENGGEVIANFPELPIGGPYEVTFTVGNRTRTVKDILVGDVYFMSGQSNMELDVNWIYHSFEKEIAAFECDQIRQFKLPVDYDFDMEQQDVAAGSWVKAIGEEKKTFGAIGFFMAKKLYEEDHVPIGLVQTAVSGCPIEAFLSRENVEKFQKIELPEVCHSKEAMKLQIQQEQKAQSRRIKGMLEQDRLQNRSHSKVDSVMQDYIGNKIENLSKDINYRVRIPILIEGKEEQAGIFTFRKTVTLPKAPEQDAILRLGVLIEADHTYVNCTEVGKTFYQYPPRRYEVPKEILHQGENEIMVKLIVTNGVARFWEEQKYELEVDGVCYDLSGAWECSKGRFSSETFQPQTFYEYLPYGVYNAMIAPLMDYPVKGILWYQGESNTGDPDGYYEKMKTLIEQFRGKMRKENMPFYYVQLADYKDMNDPDGTGWESVRQAQEQAQNIPNTYMVISRDVSPTTDLHPQDKKTIGERMAKLILQPK